MKVVKREKRTIYLLSVAVWYIKQDDRRLLWAIGSFLEET